MREGDTAPTFPRIVFPCLAILGVVVLGYVLGASVMYFDLPSSSFLRWAFAGGSVEPNYIPLASSAGTIGPVDQKEKTFDGFTLCMYASTATSSTQAFLINMNGEVVHRWAKPFTEIWPKPPHLQAKVHDSMVGFFGSYLYPNGDLLVTLHGMEDAADGYGLVKLDKDSQVLWKVAANIHHDVDVGEDGTIYAIKQELVHDKLPGLEFVPTPCLVDSLITLSPDGKEVGKPIPILEALRASPYSLLLDSLEANYAKAADHSLERKEEEKTRPTSDLMDMKIKQRSDLFHTNFVKVLTRELAPKFPLFKAGQVLFSLRDLNTIAVMDMEKRSVVWAARGPWRAQHDPQFLGNGHLLIFDNIGSRTGPRVLEYDPQTQAFPWTFPGKKDIPFLSPRRGMSQRLPNGNTLIAYSRDHEILEVTPEKEVVWSYVGHGYIHTARRYGPEELPFLTKEVRARP
jgi:hypothetical protein